MPPEPAVIVNVAVVNVLPLVWIMEPCVSMVVLVAAVMFWAVILPVPEPGTAEAEASYRLTTAPLIVAAVWVMPPTAPIIVLFSLDTILTVPVAAFAEAASILIEPLPLISGVVVMFSAALPPVTAPVKIKAPLLETFAVPTEVTSRVRADVPLVVCT